MRRTRVNRELYKYLDDLYPTYNLLMTYLYLHLGPGPRFGPAAKGEGAASTKYLQVGYKSPVHPSTNSCANQSSREAKS